ncbi:hypothetical protein BS78_09G240000 [Paspalum vaginatum]|nr:hypothetical protein BS78_09G240000 [Paspalum vaginatum]
MQAILCCRFQFQMRPIKYLRGDEEQLMLQDGRHMQQVASQGQERKGRKVALSHSKSDGVPWQRSMRGIVAENEKKARTCVDARYRWLAGQLPGSHTVTRAGFATENLRIMQRRSGGLEQSS